MNNLKNERMLRLFDLLGEHNLRFVKEPFKDLNCIICGEILVNAFRGECGCNFCKKCIDNYILVGGKRCPGDRDQCECSDLVNMVADHEVNKEISRLVVQCPEQGCHFECELIKMDDHTKFCPMRLVNCPFKKVGCQKQTTATKMNEHEQANNTLHNKLILTVIDNLRNDIGQLKENEEKNKYEIQILKEFEKKRRSLVLKTNEADMARKNGIDKNKEEIELVKERTEKVERRMKILERIVIKNKNQVDLLKQEIELKNQIIETMSYDITTERASREKLMAKIEEIRSSFEERLKEKTSGKRIEFLNKDTESQITEYDGLNDERVEENVYTSLLTETREHQLQSAIDVLMTDIKQEVRDNRREIINLTRQNKNLWEKMTERISAIEGYYNIKEEVFVWHFGEINNLSKSNSSEFFFRKDNPYKMGLQLCHDDRQLFIRLILYASRLDKNLLWPFCATVSMKIINKFYQNQSQTVKQLCTIKRPIKHSYQISDLFQFDKSLLSNLGLMAATDCAIECSIEFCD